jgi:mannosyltransferase
MPRFTATTGRWAVPLIPALTGLLLGLWRISGPSLWRDEAVTIEVAHRSVFDLARVLRHIDVVHGLYYLIMHVTVAILGDSALALRLPSTLAAAATAGLTAVLGRQLGSARLGLTAGLLVAISPMMSRYAQEGRQYSIVAALAVLATCLLVRAMARSGRAWISYGVVVALLGLIHLFALLILFAHLVSVARTRRSALRQWALATAAGLAPVAVLCVVAFGQKFQVAWIGKPTWQDVLNLMETFALAPALLIPAILLIGLGLWRSPVAPVALPWLLFPPVLLLGVSLIHPYYVQRYLLFCLPAAALLIAAGLDRLPWPAVLPAFAVTGWLVYPIHEKVRLETARADDLLKLVKILKENERPGDAVVFKDSRYRRITVTYPDAFRTLTDPLLKRSGTQVADLQGHEGPRSTFASLLDSTDRVWLIDNRLPILPGPDPAAKTKIRLLAAPPFVRLGRWTFKGGKVTLYQRQKPESLPTLTPRSARKTP